MKILVQVSKWEALAVSPVHLVAKVPGGYAVFFTKQAYTEFKSRR